MASKPRITWTAEADLAAKKHLAVHAEDLRQEAENVARRSESVSVSESYVTSAATHLRLASKNFKGADAMQGIGTTALGIGGGAIINAFQSAGKNAVVFDVPMLVYVGLCLGGVLLAAIGYAVKYGK